MTQNFAQWNVGDVILDLYKVTDFLGEGGFGKVYKVRHQGWNIDLAVKNPQARNRGSSRGVKNFEREAETWVNLGLHPHIVSCYYVRRIENSPVVFAEYVAGGSLHDWIYSRRLYEGGKETSLKRILDIAIQFAWGLHYAHEQGLIHQDVKPANVMMTAEGVVKVTDFGLANSQKVLGLLNLPIGKKVKDGVPVIVPVRIISSSGMTPGYCSPEQANGNNLTRRTDLWSWALSVLEMFQGERTWGHGTVATGALEYYLEEGSENLQLPQMPMLLAQLLRHCFRENVDERPQNMLLLAHELQEIYHQVTAEVYPQQQPQTAKDIADSINNRAVSLFDLGKPDEALRVWEQALQVQPHHLESTYNRGLVLWREAKINDEIVVRDMEQVRQSNRENWEAHYLQALIHLERDDCSTAINTLEDIRGEEAQNSKVKEALEFARERLPSSWGLHTVNQYKLLHPHFWEDYQPEEFTLSCENNILKVSEATTGKCLCILKGHTGKVNTAYITTDGKFVVSRGHDLNIKLWEIATGRCLHTLKDEEAVRGSMLGQGLLKISISLTGEREHLDPMDYYGKSQYIATLMLSQVLTTETALSINLIYEREIKQAQTAFNQGDYLVAAQHIRLARSQPGCDRTYEAMNLWASLYVRLPRKAFSGAWESNTFAEYSKKADKFCLSGDARFVLSGKNPGTLDLWEIITGRIVCTFAGNINHLGEVCLSGDNQFALSSEDGTLKLWSVRTGNCLRTFEGHTELVETLCFSGDNKFILSGSNDNTLKLWEVVTGRCLRTFEGHTKSVISVCLSADGRFALSGSRDDTLKLWEITTGRCLRSFEHPDEKRTEIEERNTRLSELEFGDYIVWDSGLRGLNSGYLSADSRFALSGSGNTLKFWDVQTGHCLRTFAGHKDSVISVCLSNDSKFALSGSADHTLKLWEVVTGSCLHTFEGHTDWVSSVFLSADSRFALSASRDKTLKLWILDWELEEELPDDSDEGIPN